jgi:endonuclease YncB( thermonuclease family)
MEKAEKMKKECPQCQKENNSEIRICACGYQFFASILEMDEVFPQYKKSSKPASSILVVCLFSIVGLLLIVVLIEPALLTSIFKKSIDEKEKTSTIDRTQLNSRPLFETNGEPIILTGQIIRGKVTSVESGDKITVKDEFTKTEYQIKLAGVVAPKPEEAMGQMAQKDLSANILNKEVFVLLNSSPADGFHSGKVVFENKDIGFQQIKAGYVKKDVLSNYLLTDADLNLYRNAENEAKSSKLGVWSADSFGSEEAKNNHESVQPNPNSEKSEASDSEKGLPKSELDAASQSQNESGISKDSLSKKQTDKTKSGNVLESSATARCRDGSLSLSKSRRGACSSHGGVSEWLGSTKNNSNEKTQQTMGKYIRGSRGGCYYINGSGNKTYVDKSLCN